MLEWGVAVIGTAVASIVAFLLTQARCGAVSLGQPVSTSTYCRALGAPGFSAEPLGIVLLAVLFVVPAGVMLAGALMPHRHGRRSLRRLACAASGVVGVSFMLLLAAHATYLAD